MLQNDALDRFGTRLEQRFSKKDIAEMLKAAEFDISTLKFSEVEPFWTFSVKKGWKKAQKGLERSTAGKLVFWQIWK